MTHCIIDLAQDSIKIRKCFMVPETQDLITILGQKLSTTLVGLNLKSMVPAVKLHHYFAFRAAEIHNVASDRMLTSELHAVQLPAT